jgi:hypothetical protein
MACEFIRSKKWGSKLKHGTSYVWGDDWHKAKTQCERFVFRMLNRDLISSDHLEQPRLYISACDSNEELRIAMDRLVLIRISHNLV